MSRYLPTFVLLASPFFTQIAAAQDQFIAFSRIDLKPKIQAATDALSEQSATLKVELPTAAGTEIANCEEDRSLISKSAKIFSSELDSSGIAFNASSLSNFKCKIEGTSSSFARFTIVSDPESGVSSFVSGHLEADKSYQLIGENDYAPSSKLAPSDALGFAVVEVKTSDLHALGDGCGTSDSIATFQNVAAPTAQLRVQAATTTKTAEVFIDIDPAADQELNPSNIPLSNTRPDLHPTIKTVISTFNGAAGLVDQAGIKLVISGLRLHSQGQSDPYPGTEGIELLQKYASRAGATALSSDIAHLVTGKDTYSVTDGVKSNDLVGLAALGAVCVYGQNVSFTEYVAIAPAIVVAHEISHNLGASHEQLTDCTQRDLLMCPTLATTATKLSERAKAEIAAVVRSASCLSSTGSSTPTPTPTRTPVATSTPTNTPTATPTPGRGTPTATPTNTPSTNTTPIPTATVTPSTPAHPNGSGRTYAPRVFIGKTSRTTLSFFWLSPPSKPVAYRVFGVTKRRLGAKLLATLPATTTNFTWSGLSAGQRYRLVVTAVYAQGTDVSNLRFVEIPSRQMMVRTDIPEYCAGLSKEKRATIRECVIR